VEQARCIIPHLPRLVLTIAGARKRKYEEPGPNPETRRYIMGSQKTAGQGVIPGKREYDPPKIAITRQRLGPDG